MLGSTISLKSVLRWTPSLGKAADRKKGHRSWGEAGLEAKGSVQADSTPLELEMIERPDLGPLAKLPPFKPVVISLLRLFDREDVSVAEITELAQSDPAVFSELLALVNSPLYGIRMEITDAGHAVALLGIEPTKELASTLALRALMSGAPRTPVVRRFWMHSIAAATVARAIAPEFHVSPGLAHAAAMIHDLGRMGLLAAHTQDYETFALRAYQATDEVLAAEKMQFGMDHCHAGRLLAEAWGLPMVFHEAVSSHHEQIEGEGCGSVVQLSCLLADDFMFQSILHRSAQRPLETIRLRAPEQVREALCGKMKALEGEVIDVIRLRDF